jgi:DNA-binding NarL/FixJ family response regulator
MTPSPKISLVIADDHAILREGVAKLLTDYHDLEVVGEAIDGQQALELVERLQPDILITDINMPQCSGFVVLEQVIARALPTKVLFLTMLDAQEFVFKAGVLGVSGYLSKDTVKTELVTAIRAVNSGKTYYGQSIMHKIITNSHPRNAGNTPEKKLHELLSPREYEILHLVSEGLSSKQISEKLFISERTVANHRLNIMNKCGVKNAVELVKLYLQSTGTL